MKGPRAMETVDAQSATEQRAAAADYVEPSQSSRRRSRIASVAAMITLVAAAGGALYLRGNGGGDLAASAEASGSYELPSLSGPCTVEDLLPPSDPVELQQYNDAARKAQAYEEATGWTRYSGLDLDGERMCGWIRHAKLDMEGFEALAGGREPVYDHVDGDVIGYSYPALGFVPPELADDPGFDPTAARIERSGCDPLGPDPECVAVSPQS